MFSSISPNLTFKSKIAEKYNEIYLLLAYLINPILVQDLGRSMSPPRGGNDIVFFRMVIGYPDHP